MSCREDLCQGIKRGRLSYSFCGSTVVYSRAHWQEQMSINLQEVSVKTESKRFLLPAPPDVCKAPGCVGGADHLGVLRVILAPPCTIDLQPTHCKQCNEENLLSFSAYPPFCQNFLSVSSLLSTWSSSGPQSLHTESCSPLSACALTLPE